MSHELHPFQIRFQHLKLPDIECKLPFAVGGATQFHSSAFAECQNSQDASAICIGQDYIVAVVADGCTSSHLDFEATSLSNNEVGAKFLAHAVAGAVRDFAPMMIDKPETFIEKVRRDALKKLSLVTTVMVGKDKSSRQRFVADFLMATVLGFVVAKDDYVVFHCGDGIIGLNGTLRILEEAAGSYLANSTFSGDDRIPSSLLRIYAHGKTNELENIFLSTDGLTQLVREYPSEVSAFIKSRPTQEQVSNGFDFLLQEFRSKLAWNKQIRFNVEDDASFALLRRTQPAGQENAEN